MWGHRCSAMAIHLYDAAETHMAARRELMRWSGAGGRSPSPSPHWRHAARPRHDDDLRAVAGDRPDDRLPDLRRRGGGGLRHLRPQLVAGSLTLAGVANGA